MLGSGGLRDQPLADAPVDLQRVPRYKANTIPHIGVMTDTWVEEGGAKEPWERETEPEIDRSIDLSIVICLYIHINSSFTCPRARVISAALRAERK